MRTIRRLRQRHRGESGNALMEFSMLGVTVLIPLLYIMLTVFDIQRAMYGVSAAAREATRAFTLQDSVPEAQAAAKHSAELAMQDQGLEGFTIPDVTCSKDGKKSPAYCLEPGSAASIRIEYDVQLPYVPQMFDVETAIGVASEHTTPFGQYRTGLGG